MNKPDHLVLKKIKILFLNNQINKKTENFNFLKTQKKKNPTNSSQKFDN